MTRMLERRKFQPNRRNSRRPRGSGVRQSVIKLLKDQKAQKHLDRFAQLDRRDQVGLTGLQIKKLLTKLIGCEPRNREMRVAIHS